jgi:hypothetical protein
MLALVTFPARIVKTLGTPLKDHEKTMKLYKGRERGKNCCQKIIRSHKFACYLMLAIPLVLFATNTSVNAQEAGCPAGMIHYWMLDENVSPYFDSYGGDTATCTNCPTATAGIISGAQQFGSATSVSASDDNTFDWGKDDSFSIEFWMKPDIGNTCAGTEVAVGRNDNTTPLNWWV